METIIAIIMTSHQKKAMLYAASWIALSCVKNSSSTYNYSMYLKGHGFSQVEKFNIIYTKNTVTFWKVRILYCQ